MSVWSAAYEAVAIMRNREPKECEVCGAVFTPLHGSQKMCQECRDYIEKGKYIRWCGYSDIEYSERKIRERFEEAERNCTIKGEGYAERQIRQSLALAGPVNTTLEKKEQ